MASRRSSSTVDLKHIDTSLAPLYFNFTPSGPDWGFSGLPLTDVLPGTSFYQRVGSVIQLVSLDVCFRLQFAPSFLYPSPFPEFLLRLAFVFDSSPNSLYPSIEDIFQDTDSSGSTSTTVHSGLNTNQVNRYLLLHEIFITTPSSTNTSSNWAPPCQDSYVLTRQFNIKLDGLSSIFSSNPPLPGVSGINSGAIYCVALSSGRAFNYWSITGTARLYYLDN